ncbi:hypothetical protein Salmuc_02208 [Salipiger mucosus DSM 16094]|uniref:Aldose 1-epimerase n=1 Tax=Salipiger mucosus DSM 16094 TaxID=1123237 RepID=S9S078_9RHOB|nr:hypothetical protein Salmuc_02208 [Salipiger mucosus DSM 16094]
MARERETYDIRNARLAARFAPSAGGRILSLTHVEHGDILVPLRDTSFDPANWPKAGAFPLFPFHNRLRDAAFRLAGQQVRLRPNTANGKDVMHGPAHRRPWRLALREADLLEMVLDYRSDEDWPFDFTARQRFELKEDGLAIRLELTNTGRFDMPGGIGWHPYFMHSGEIRVRVTAARQWTPFGPAGLSASVAWNNAASCDPGPATGVTRHYSGWRTATAQVDDGIAISLSGDAALSHLAVLQKTDYLCIEPASHVAGALETLPNACAETGLRLLRPGERLSGTTLLRVN